ncbi:MAG: hypothetical protein K2X60_10270 [Xanthobacteraceae bacterium]|nr:hypothetical protein [Xanthobacteraceae bacterium]
MHSGWALICAAAFCLSLTGVAMPRGARAADTLEARKLPMTFKWVAAKPGTCEADCRDWIAAVGIITGDTPAQFDDFTRGRDLKGLRIVLDSSGGSVLDAIAMGRVWRSRGVLASVGMVTERDGSRTIMPEGYCESMCVFLLLGGATREIPPQAHIRVHQIWMGDRANDAKAAKYSADDMTIVERDVGRLAKYTFDMGGSGDLLALALSVPPWEPLHELTAAELVSGNLIAASAVADNAAPKTDAPKVADVTPVKAQDRVTSTDGVPAKPTKTAEALPTGGMALAAPAH